MEGQIHPKGVCVLWGLVCLFLVAAGCKTTPVKPDSKDKNPPPHGKVNPPKKVPTRNKVPPPPIPFSAQVKEGRVSRHPTFAWKYPEAWKIRSALLNIYTKKEYEGGGRPELVIFDLKSVERLDLKGKTSRFRYHGRMAQSLTLEGNTVYVATLVVMSDRQNAVQKIEFTTESPSKK